MTKITINLSEINHLHVDIFLFDEVGGLMVPVTWSDNCRGIDVVKSVMPASWVLPLAECTYTNHWDNEDVAAAQSHDHWHSQLSRGSHRGLRGGAAAQHHQSRASALADQIAQNFSHSSQRSKQRMSDARDGLYTLSRKVLETRREEQLLEVDRVFELLKDDPVSFRLRLRRADALALIEAIDDELTLRGSQKPGATMPCPSQATLVLERLYGRTWTIAPGSLVTPGDCPPGTMFVNEAETTGVSFGNTDKGAVAMAQFSANPGQTRGGYCKELSALVAGVRNSIHPEAAAKFIINGLQPKPPDAEEVLRQVTDELHANEAEISAWIGTQCLRTCRGETLPPLSSKLKSRRARLNKYDALRLGFTADNHCDHLSGEFELSCSALEEKVGCDCSGCTGCQLDNNQ